MSFRLQGGPCLDKIRRLIINEWIMSVPNLRLKKKDYGEMSSLGRTQLRFGHTPIWRFKCNRFC